MIKHKDSNNLTQKPYTINMDYHGVLIEKLIKNKGFSSASDVVRRGIESIYEHFYPPYKEPSVNQKIKAKSLDDAAAFDSMSPEVFAASVKAKIFTDSYGTQFAVFWAWNNCIRSTPLKNLKELFTNNPGLSDIATFPGNRPIPDSYSDSELIKIVV